MKPMDNPEESLLQEALQRHAGVEREAFLDGACVGDPALRARLKARLESPGNSDLLLEAKAAPSEQATVEMPAEEGPGTMIGHYKVREKIGEGGCGVVYLADQEQPVRRRVAVKVIKLGMDTRHVVARFEAERQALALMDHPNIAKVLDAGATTTGRPYFVMELVRGVRITDYCDQNHLPTQERLKLFIQVCHAAHHAHQKGVIHRDIKPSNILVMVADDVPVPKMIDFGIAKAIGERLTDKTVYTQYQHFIGTPAYMSPEQAGMSGLDVDTRSDIYSLGVLLYELMTGQTPIESRQLAQTGLEEMLRRIREEEPPKPSTRLSRLERQEQTTTAQRHATEVPRLIRSMRGDLDWIVMKCLEKNRTRRYETANELARDIESHLANRPVSAAAPTLSYRALKYIRRHGRVLATTGALVSMALLGTALILWQARRAGQAESERAALRKARWALDEALPEIERSLGKDEYTTAFKLVEQVRPIIGQDPRFKALSDRVVSVISVETAPAGAEVFIRDYRDLEPGWEPLGKSPLTQAKIPRGFKRWKITTQGHEVAEGALLAQSAPVELKRALTRTGTVPPGMVLVPGREHKANLGHLDSTALPALNLPDFLFDRYEVSNRRFKEFVQAGGYRKPECWKHTFVKDGVELGWQAAMKLFVDETGQPGPATWRNGDLPAGQDDYPVGGVSWYEAAAYAEFAGKRLPTVYDWSLAAGDLSQIEVGFLVPLSNFRGKGPVPAGTSQGMTSQGIYDMAGNVKEWCFNDAQGGYRASAGGGWNEPEYMFFKADKYPPFLREPNFGFRCMKTLADDSVWEKAKCSVQYEQPPVLGDQKPCSDEVFQVYRRLYDYNKSDLHPRVEVSEDLNVYTRREKVTFDAAYGNERMIAYIHFPRAGKPPFQTVVYWPGSGALNANSIATYGNADMYEHHPRNGRVFVCPVLHGTFERRLPSQRKDILFDPANGILWVKDFRRTLDYLETRPDLFDTNRLAYEGYSWGGVWGGILPAIDARLKVAVIIAGGLDFKLLPECGQINYASRVAIPVLLVSGKYDFIFPIETNVKPYLSLFGTAEKDKQLRIYEAGHSVWRIAEMRQDEADFLDKYLGPAK